MTSSTKVERALAGAVQDLSAEKQRFALVGGLRLIAERGFARRQDLNAKLATLFK